MTIEIVVTIVILILAAIKISQPKVVFPEDIQAELDRVTATNNELGRICRQILAAATRKNDWWSKDLTVYQSGSDSSCYWYPCGQDTYNKLFAGNGDGLRLWLEKSVNDLSENTLQLEIGRRGRTSDEFLAIIHFVRLDDRR